MFISNSYYEPASRKKRELSKHAQKRSQQRGIAEGSVKLVIAFGEREYDNQGCIRYLMTDKAVRDLCIVAGNTQQVQALKGVYAVLSTDGHTVITLAHRYS
jgi:xanthine dehydrogenase molybdopterin-binding subunit B